MAPRLTVSFVTLFPRMFESPFAFSIIKRALDQKIIDIQYTDIRQFGIGKYQSVDDHPFGGGPGMLLRIDVLYKALQAAKKNRRSIKRRVILTTPAGKAFTQQKARDLSTYSHLIFICGHYEGYDNRIRHFVDEELSIGDYVLTGGELPAMCMTDSIVRLLPGVLKKEDATTQESFSLPILEYPQFTRPAIFKKLTVPKILLSGNHQSVKEWKENEAKKITGRLRPDLLRRP